MTFTALAAIVVSALVALTVASPASGAAATACGDKVLADWFDNGRIDRLYPLHCYEDAIDAIPDDLRDYADAEEVTPEVEAGELLRVKVRYKLPGATAEDAAREVVAALLPGELLTDPAKADPDLRWAIAVASFAELLRRSPYLTPSVLPELRALLEPSQGDEPARREFFTLFDQAAALLAPGQR